MAEKVEVVIKIPKYYLTHPQDYSCLAECVRRGVLLPKGHGNLKDFDKIEWYGCDFEGKACEKANGDCSVCSHANCDAKQVRELPTIIEADNAESED